MASRLPFPTRPPVPTTFPAGRACFYCSTREAGDLVDAGGGVGIAHERCFVAWDRTDEWLEFAHARQVVTDGEFAGPAGRQAA